MFNPGLTLTSFRTTRPWKLYSNKPIIDPPHKCLPIINYFVVIKISLTNLIFELIIQKNFYSQFSEPNLNAYKRILNWQLFMKRVYKNQQ